VFSPGIFGKDEVIRRQRAGLPVNRKVEAIGKEGLNHAPLEVAVLLRRETLDLVGPDGGDFEGRGRNLRVGQPAGEE
jgi:hypothetical protein